jgi:hypothetical protein
MLTLSAYVRFSRLPEGTHVNISTDVTLDGQIVHRSGLTTSLQSSDAIDVWQHSNFAPQRAGTYTFSATVLANGKQRQKSTTFASIAPPPVPRRLSFTFDSLRSLDSRGLQVAAVRPTERVFIDAHWVVRGSSGNAPLLVTETLEYPAGGGWRALGSPLQNSFDTTNGPHDYRFTFVPGAAYNALRIVVDLTIGKGTQRRSVTVQIRR